MREFGNMSVEEGLKQTFSVIADVPELIPEIR